jgi:hypothetical protein
VGFYGFFLFVFGLFINFNLARKISNLRSPHLSLANYFLMVVLLVTNLLRFD